MTSYDHSLHSNATLVCISLHKTTDKCCTNWGKDLNDKISDQITLGLQIARVWYYERSRSVLELWQINLQIDETSFLSQQNVTGVMAKDMTVISTNSEIWNNNLWSYNARFQTVCMTPVPLSLQEYNWQTFYIPLSWKRKSFSSSHMKSLTAYFFFFFSHRVHSQQLNTFKHPPFHLFKSTASISPRIKTSIPCHGIKSSMSVIAVNY